MCLKQAIWREGERVKHDEHLKLEVSLQFAMNVPAALLADFPKITPTGSNFFFEDIFQ